MWGLVNTVEIENDWKGWQGERNSWSQWDDGVDAGRPESPAVCAPRAPFEAPAAPLTNPCYSIDRLRLFENRSAAAQKPERDRDCKE